MLGRKCRGFGGGAVPAHPMPADAATAVPSASTTTPRQNPTTILPGENAHEDFALDENDLLAPFTLA
jgi:hypothetical protein